MIETFKIRSLTILSNLKEMVLIKSLCSLRPDSKLLIWSLIDEIGSLYESLIKGLPIDSN